MKLALLVISGMFTALPTITLEAEAEAEAEVSVYFYETSVQPLNAAIRAALARAPFKLVNKVAPGVLVIHVPGRVDSQRHGDTAVRWQFTTRFSCNGDSLGESFQYCFNSEVDDCSEQVRVDAMAALELYAGH
jgi:hypothetical protein